MEDTLVSCSWSPLIQGSSMVGYIFIFSLFLNERQHVTGQVFKSYSWLSTLNGQKHQIIEGNNF